MTGKKPRLETPLVLETAQTSPDGGGGINRSWTALGTHWAELDPASARDSVPGLRRAATITHRIRIRSVPQGSPQYPAADQRFRLDQRVFSIIAVSQEAGSGYLRIWAEEGATP